MAITPTETPTPIPAFAPVERPELLPPELGAELVVAAPEVAAAAELVAVEELVPVVGVTSTDVDTVSVDCHARPTGIAWYIGLAQEIAVVVAGVTPTTVNVIVVATSVVLIHGSGVYQARGLVVATSNPLEDIRRSSCQFPSCFIEIEIIIAYLGQHVARVSKLATPYEANVVAAMEYPLGHTSPGENVCAEVAQPDG
jgi:hypothetical protein